MNQIIARLIGQKAEQAQLEALDAIRGTTGHHSDLAKQVKALGFKVLADSDDNELTTIRLVGVYAADGSDVAVGVIRGDAEAVIE